jgi:hypothetical protein
VEGHDWKASTMVRRRHLVEALIGLVLGGVAIVAVASGVSAYTPHKQAYPYIPSADYISIPSGRSAPAAADTPGSRIESVPVLSWHQMDNGCAATAAQCSSPEYSESSVTQRQFYDELSWLHAHGYQTISADQYVAWATGRPVMLPAKPALLTVDDGIANFYAGATPVLQHFGYSMVSMVVSGFAQGAQDGVRKYKGWDATWTQLGNLPSGTSSFAFHAGPEGHLQNASAVCPYFYPCQRAGESASAYQARVTEDVNAGLAAEQSNLGSRVDTEMWAVPFNDLAQAPDEPQSGQAPQKWLEDYAVSKFAVVFVDGYTSRANQHYRYEVHGADSLSYFAAQVNRTDIYTRISGPATATARAGGPS